jgi:hypothetical protein
VDDPTDLILVGADKRKITEQWAFEDMAAILSQLGGGEATLGGLNAQLIARFETRQAVPAGLVHAVRFRASPSIEARRSEPARPRRAPRSCWHARPSPSRRRLPR